MIAVRLLEERYRKHRSGNSTRTRDLAEDDLQLEARLETCNGLIKQPEVSKGFRPRLPFRTSDKPSSNQVGPWQVNHASRSKKHIATQCPFSFVRPKENGRKEKGAEIATHESLPTPRAVHLGTQITLEFAEM